MSTKERDQEVQLASFWNMKFKEAMVAKAPYIKKWQTYWDAYYGDYFKNTKLPDYKSDLVSNYIFSIIETIRPIMLDNSPKFQAMPRQPEGMAYSSDLQEAFSYEWDREQLTKKTYRELITTLVTGTSVFFIPWNAKEKNIKGIPVNPFNLFPDPLATTVEDAEYMIYATYHNVQLLRKQFPNKAKYLTGADVNYGELVYNNNKNANLDNQVLVLEVYTRDYETMDKDDKGNAKLKFPNGRVITLCPELGVVLSDKPLAYEDKEFPFILMKDYDVPGKFWGEGEVAQLLSPQKYMNELNNAVIDHAKTTANSPWIVDKNSGIPYGKITARQGLVIRKNPGSEVRREAPQQMPMHVINAIETMKNDMEQISGVFDTVKGNSETGVYTAQGILALQEAGQARIRLKVKLLEDSLSKLAQLWFSRMKQFWKDDRFIRITKADGSYDIRQLERTALEQEYDIKITAGSTMPVNRGAMLDLMIRLAQTPMPDGQNLVDREAVVQYLPEEAKAPLLKRMDGENQNMAQLQQQMEELATQLQQALEQNSANDEQTMSVVEEITGALEKVNQQILQMKNENDRLKEEQAQEEKLTKARTDGYNEGYTDAEKLVMSEEEEPVTEGEGALTEEALPNDILTGLEDMSDDELALLLEQNPELSDLIR